MPEAIETVKQLLGTGKPIFGICLGHQLLALANDIPTYKMHHGHRGINHPVLNLMTQKSEITSQNHGFGVLAEAVYAKSDTIRVTHKNLNDDTIEGIEMLHYPAFSVQFHPEAAPGPHDSRYLFDNFVTLMENSATERVRVSAKLEIAQKLLAQGFDRKTVAGITELTEMQLAGL
jgi:carbamoyl-phosphate synthase small subunit